MGHKILIVDDDRGFIELLKNVLRKAGYEVFTAKDGNEGLAIVKENSVDLILLDVVMPTLNGYEFLRALRGFESLEGSPPVPVLVITAKEGMKDLFMFEGVKEYLIKTIEVPEIIKKIEQYLGPKGRNVS